MAWLACCRGPGVEQKPDAGGSREPGAVQSADVSALPDSTPGPPASSTALVAPSVPPDPSGRLVVGVSGKAMAWERAFVKRHPDGKLSLYVGQKGSCDELLRNVFDDPFPHVLIDLPAKLAPDGSERFTVGTVHFGPPTEASPGGLARVRGDASARRKTEVELAFTARADRGEALDVKGKVIADGCGDADTSRGPLPKAKHASTAVLTVAKKRIPLRGAIVRGKSVELTDFPRDCDAAWYLGARLRLEGGSWRLDGMRFMGTSAADAPALSVVRGAAGTSADGPTVELELSGADRVGDFDVKLSGKLEAISCQ